MNAKKVSPFIGGGILFGTKSTESKPGAAAPLGSTLPFQSVTTNADGYTSFGIFGLMGIEYFVTDAVSLSAEYRIGYNTLSIKDTEVTHPAPTATTITKGGSGSNFGLTNSGALTLAIYF